MIRRQKRREYPPARPLSNWAIALGAVIVLAIAVFAGVILGHRYGGAGASVELDAIRTAGALVVGTGGAVALLLAARRQRSTELTLVHTEHDATERRITELYTKAADQLGSDQAPVRLAGLYALERLAHSTVEHRQTIVDVICAYLRMPYTPPPETPQTGVRYRGPRPRRRRQSLINEHRSRSGAAPTDRHQQPRQERQVRLTAQDILARNLRLPKSHRRWWTPWRVYREPPWPGIRLNLNRALLLDVNLMNCRIAAADFNGARFTGTTSFSDAQFTGTAFFHDAQFTGTAFFDYAQFTGTVSFHSAQFTCTTRTTSFSDAQFTAEAYFTGAQFTGTAYFDGAQFTTLLAFFDGAHASGPGLETVWPPGWTTRPAQPDNGEDPAARYLVRSDDQAG